MSDFNQWLADNGYKTGYIPRNYSKYPPGYIEAAPVFDTSFLIPENEWASRLKDQQDAKAGLIDLRERYYDILKSLNQNPYGLCWYFSSTKSVMYQRASDGVPIKLSPWWGAGKINNWRDRGGWGSASLEHMVEHGLPKYELCPAYDRRYDTPETVADAATHKQTEWWDGTDSREQNKKIMVSSFLMGLPPVLDFNHISHSMCGCYLESINPLVVYCDNSWDAINDFGPKGLYRLEGNKAIPDGIVVPRWGKVQP